MKDIDILLAKEYSKRHGLYDKKSPHFKDKHYNETAWREISNLLGYSVSVLKDRMLQLRNRYNVEKRKFDHYKSRDPDAVAVWPLFYHLDFLDGHIRPRRKYRNAGRRSYHNTLVVSSINPLANRRRGRPPKKFIYTPEYDVNDANLPQQSLMIEKDVSMASNFTQNSTNVKTDEGIDTSNVTVKAEIVTNSEEEEEEDEDESADQFINPVNLLAQPTSTDPEANHAPFNHVTNVDEYEQPTQSVQVLNNQPTSSSSNSPLLVNGQPRKRKHDDLILKLHRSPCKYQAFGQFVTATLAELPEDKALSLIENFTVQIVSTMKN